MTRKQFFRLLFTCVAMLTPSFARSHAEDERELIDRWYAAFDEITETLEVTGEAIQPGMDVETLSCLTTLRHSGRNATGKHYGRVYVWAQGGRPIIVGCIFSQFKAGEMGRRVGYEFHSLCESGVEVRQGDSILWSCDSPGLKWMDHPSSGPPDETRPRRLTRMRNVARSYSVTSPGGVEQSLSQPIFRYPEARKDVVDGAIFAYGNGNDPKVYLCIEGRKNAWKIAFARSTIVPLQAELNGKVVWNVEQAPWPESNKPFFINWMVEYRDPSDPTKVLAAPSR